MYQGFGFNQPGRKVPDEGNFNNRAHEMQRQFIPPNAENNAYQNFNQQNTEETNDNIQIPHHIKVLFDSEEKVNFENRGQRINSGGQRARDDMRQMVPNQMNYGNMMQLQNFNALVNQSNEFARMTAGLQNNLDVSNLSNRESANPASLNNISRDSRNESKVNLNSSKRNTSSRSINKDKNHQVSINEDISLVERIELSLNQITLNHNKICPFCSKTIDIRKCNFQNISAFLSNTSRKYYLIHFDCYLKSNSAHSPTQILPLSGIVEGRVNAQINALTAIDMNHFLRSDRKAYFVSIEGYHAISSYLLFKIDKLCHGLEHATYRNHLLYLNFSTPTTSIFEPNSYAIPFSEFRVVITIYTSHTNEEPYSFEYLVDFSQIKVSSEQKTKPVEVFYLHGENNIVMGTNVVFDPNSELVSNLNYTGNLDSSFQSTGSTTSMKPDFGKNLFIVLKYITVSLPLKRVEKRIKEAAVASQEESSTSQQKASAQKKQHTKLKLNSNAPLFSTPFDYSQQNPEFEPNPQALFVTGLQGAPGTPGMQGIHNIQALQSGNQLPNNFAGNKQPLKPNPPPMNQGPNPNAHFGSFNMMNQGPNLNSNMGNSNLNPRLNNSNPLFNPQQQFANQNYQMEQQQHHQLQHQQQQQQQQQHHHQQQQQQHQQQMLQNAQFNKKFQIPQEFNFPGNFAQNQQGDFHKPPGLNMLPPNIQNPMVNQAFSQQSGFPNANININDVQNRKKPLQVETSGPNSGSFHSNNAPMMEILAHQLEALEMPATPDKPVLEEPPEGFGLERGRIKSLSNNLYTAVLSGKQREGSLSKSPSLSKIQNKYFSGFSTPRSENTFTPPQANTPLKRSTPNGSNADVGTDDNEQWTDDMIDNFKLENYMDNLVEFAKTYNGSRVLQKFFPRANQSEIDAVINKIQDDIDNLMLDPYANYMFQTLAQSCSSEQRYNLLQKIAPSMIKIACDRKGTHSLQAIVSLINRDVEDKLLRSILEGHVLDLTLDAQGTHLIQKLVVAVSLNNVGFIYEPVMERFLEVANNSFGLCVLKQLITKSEKVPFMRDTIVGLLYENLEELIQNPYGNYAVQHALDSYPSNCNGILDKILDKITQYSNQKYSSNVIEKCLVLSTPEYKKRFVQEIIKNDRIIELMKNKYGNFVILKILSISAPEDKTAVMQSLSKNVNAVNVTKYKNRWLQFIEENPMKIQGFTSRPSQKPSLFRTNSQTNMNHFSDEASDNDSGWPGEETSATKLGIKKKNTSKAAKEGKSQFFKNDGKPFDNNMPNQGDFGYFGQGQGQPRHPFNNSPGIRQFAEGNDRGQYGGSAGLGGQGGQGGQGGHRGPNNQRNNNQNRNDGNKRGYNHFY